MRTKAAKLIDRTFLKKAVYRGSGPDYKFRGGPHSMSANAPLPPFCSNLHIPPWKPGRPGLANSVLWSFLSFGLGPVIVIHNGREVGEVLAVMV